VGEVLWSDLTIKPECKQKDPQCSLAAAWICGFTVVPTSSSSQATISPSSSSHVKRVSCLFWMGSHSAHLVGPLAALSCLLTFCRVSLATAHAVQPPCLTTTGQEPSYLSGLEPGSALELRLSWSFFGHCSHSSASQPWLPQESSYLSVEPCSPPWVAFGYCSPGPAFLPDYLENHLT
jgi:hypothetical protein